MKLTYEELVAEQVRWHPIILWCFRNKAPSPSKKASLILSAIVEWAGWTQEEFYQEVMRRTRQRRLP